MPELDLKPGRHSIEGFAVDAEDFGGALAVVAGGVQDKEDAAALDFVEVGETGKELREIISQRQTRAGCTRDAGC